MADKEGVIAPVDRNRDGFYDPDVYCSTIIAGPKGNVMRITFLDSNIITYESYFRFCLQDIMDVSFVVL